MILATTLILAAPITSLADTNWTNVDCGGINESLQSSTVLEAGQISLGDANLLVLILGNKAVYGWQNSRPMPTNLYVGAHIKSVENLNPPKGITASYFVVINSKNHSPDTQVLCNFTNMSAPN